MPIWGERRLTWRQILPPAAVAVAIVAVGLAIRHYRALSNPGFVRRREEFRFYMARLHNAEPSTRAAAARLLGEVGDPRAVPEIRKLLSDDDPRVVGAACAALGKLGDTDSAAKLLENLDSNDPAIVAGAVEGLGELGASDAAPRILPLLDSPEKDVRLAAIVALGKLGDTTALDALEKLRSTPWEGLDDNLTDDERERFQGALEAAIAQLSQK